MCWFMGFVLSLLLNAIIGDTLTCLHVDEMCRPSTTGEQHFRVGCFRCLISMSFLWMAGLMKHTTFVPSVYGVGLTRGGFIYKALHWLGFDQGFDHRCGHIDLLLYLLLILLIQLYSSSLNGAVHSLIVIPFHHGACKLIHTTDSKVEGI